MSIVEFDRPPSLKASKTGESTKCRRVEAVGLIAQLPKWQTVELNDRYVRCDGKIGDCEQSTQQLS